MTAALLCPGPSLSKVTPSDLWGYDLRIGVNRAAIFFECQWWGALDYPSIRNEQAKVIGTPKLLTRRQTWDDIGKRCRIKDYRLVENIGVPVAGWDFYTATACLGFLATLGATVIDVYGADWAVDGKDFDGQLQDGSDRSAARFEREKKIWDSLTNWMLARGIEVRRVLQ